MFAKKLGLLVGKVAGYTVKGSIGVKDGTKTFITSVGEGYRHVQPAKPAIKTEVENASPAE